MCSSAVRTTGPMSAAGSPEETRGPETEPKGTKRKISLHGCAVCASEEAKYRCPACLDHSCSLQCVKKHKEDSGCTGVRNKTAFVPLSHFDEMALLSDYRFLEDTGRFADGATRDNLIRTPRSTIKAKKLASYARKMNITLRLLPITFTKSRENSTFFLTKEQLFLWHLKLIFPQSSTEFSQRRVSDKQTLEQILTPYIHPTESDPVTRQKLKVYVHPPFDHVKVFMKAEGRKANSVRYHELDVRKSLRDNLSYKTLIEYPVLHVVLRDHWKDYPLKGPAEPASAGKGFAVKKLDQEMEDETQVLPSRQGVCTPSGTGICAGTTETSPETEPPREKRAKREPGEEEPEEGEIIDSGDEEKEEEDEGNNEENSSCGKSCGGPKGPSNDTEVIKHEPAPAVNVDAGLNEHSASGRDRCVNQDVTGFTDDRLAARESAEVSMTKEHAVKEPGPVHTRHSPDENESANADGCGPE